MDSSARTALGTALAGALVVGFILLVRDPVKSEPPPPPALNLPPRGSVDPARVDELPPVNPTTCDTGASIVQESDLPSASVSIGCARGEGDARRREGKWVVRYKDGSITAGEYAAALQHGPWKTWDAVGKKIRETPFASGRVHGMQIEWTSNGERAAVREFRDGVQDGPSVVYFPGGHVVREMWSRGTLVSSQASSPPSASASSSAK